MKRPLRLAAAVPLAASVVLAVGCAAPAPSRELYQWTDAAGSVRYTAYRDQVPDARLHTRRLVLPGSAAHESASLPRTPLPVAEDPADPPQVPAGVSPLDRRIAALEARIAADEEALKQLISDPEKAGTLRSAPELRAIGERLPALQAELQALREQRATRTGTGDAGDAGSGPDGS